MAEYTLPEIQRCPLTEICLNAKMLVGESSTIEDFLNKAVQPPPIENIRESIKKLQQMSVLDNFGH